MAYWYNVNTGQVEAGDDTNSKSDMMGPYATEDEARNALDTAHAKSEQWDREDREFEGDSWGTDAASSDDAS